MDYIPDHFKIKPVPAPDAAAVVKTEHARFTVLTPRMMRMEWSPTGAFEDRASQPFWYRTQPVPAFTTQRSGAELIIETEFLRLHYTPDQPFTADNLWIELKEMQAKLRPEDMESATERTSRRGRPQDTHRLGGTWYFGDPDPGNLGGTARTVDGIDGATPVGVGLMSRSGWSLVDDSKSLVFNNVGWLEPREAPEKQMDLYFFGYGHDYLGCLRDFNRVAGPVPMIPRFVLGNWWSRFWKFTEESLKQLINDFQRYQVPLSVCIIDMDWHLTETNNDSSGWTGYTWNRKLFPDPEGMLQFLHEKGLKVALNLHPAEGIHRHEEMYEAMSQAVGQDPSKGEPVEFDITNPRFVDAYLKILHHPQEARGVDFWWMDWQQGARTRLSGLDPLWWLNHLHFLDLGRDGKRRSFIFSRWGGLGNHRYPIGFSGDSVVSWASLAFQPYFSATAANVNYGWWSHDIGGHMGGVEDSELYTRWVQMGVFQPILRLHSTNNPYHERTPWGWDANTLVAARQAFQLRHALIPYLYSMAWRYHHDNIPPLLPMYYQHTENDEAYACPNQYAFGDQLVVAPFITPQNPETRQSRAVAWLPEGDWYDYFSGQYYAGNGWHAVYGTLDAIPVFAKAGAIVPQGPLAGWDNVESPDHLLVHVFPGADGQFTLYEDESNTNAYLEGAYGLTPMRQTWSAHQTVLTIGPAEGAVSLLPASRSYELIFRGFHQPEQVVIKVNGQAVKAESHYDAHTSSMVISGLQIKPADRLEVTLSSAQDLAIRDDSRLATCLRLVRSFKLESWTKAALAQYLPEIIADPSKLARGLAQISQAQMRALMETITGAGIDYTESTGEPLIVVWNNNQDTQVNQIFSLARLHNFWMYKERNPWANAAAPRFVAYRPKVDFGEHNPWVVQLEYYQLAIVKMEGK